MSELRHEPEAEWRDILSDWLEDNDPRLEEAKAFIIAQRGEDYLLAMLGDIETERKLWDFSMYLLEQSKKAQER